MFANHRIEAPLARSQEFLVAMRAVAHRGVEPFSSAELNVCFRGKKDVARTCQYVR